MKRIAPIILSLCIAPTAVSATEKPADRLMEFFELFSKDAQNMLDEMVTEFGPILEDLRERVDDLTNYEAPEVLPNGDILIRRKKTAPKVDPTTQTDL